MKKLFAIGLCLLVSGALNPSFAQDSKKELKAQNRIISAKDKILQDRYKQRELKDARKEAKQLTKDGFMASAGALSIEKQLDKSYKAQIEVDKNGSPLYIVASQTAVGGSFSAAKMQATNLAKLDIAGQIEADIAQIIDSQVSSEELGADEASTLISTVSAAKTTIQQNMGRTIPFVEIYKKLKNGNTELRVTIGYNIEEAFNVVKKAVKEKLAARGDALADEVDKLF
ncbi:MAG: hypothetical protein RR931_06325 [Mucinivorans sp.]